jgi:hypothetical protein
MAAVLAGPSVRKNLSGKLSEPECIIKVPKGKQTSVGGDLGTVELQLEAGVKRDPESGIVFFTRRPVQARLTLADHLAEEQTKFGRTLHAEARIWGMQA